MVADTHEFITNHVAFKCDRFIKKRILLITTAMTFINPDMQQQWNASKMDTIVK